MEDVWPPDKILSYVVVAMRDFSLGQQKRRKEEPEKEKSRRINLSSSQDGLLFVGPIVFFSSWGSERKTTRMWRLIYSQFRLKIKTSRMIVTEIKGLRDLGEQEEEEEEFKAPIPFEGHRNRRRRSIGRWTRNNKLSIMSR